MQIDDSDVKKACEVHAKFAGLRFSDHIASIWSLTHLSALMRKLKPARVLEVGAGIGTVTSLLTGMGAEVTAVERYEMFRRELRRNVGDLPGLTLISKIREVQGAHPLVIIDGPFSPRLLTHLKPGVTIFIEGSRATQRRGITESLKANGLIAEFESYVPADRTTQKGCHVALVKAA